jgi:hypothetical protein
VICFVCLKTKPVGEPDAGNPHVRFRVIGGDPLSVTTETYDLEVTQLSPLGVRRDFQQALAEVRTDLDAFTAAESLCLMACGYQMAGKALDDNLPALGKVW